MINKINNLLIVYLKCVHIYLILVVVKYFYCMLLICIIILRVLKPPGGGSSDIFGSASSDEVNPHKRGTNQKNLQSSIILGGNSPVKTSNATNGNSDKPGKFKC